MKATGNEGRNVPEDSGSERLAKVVAVSMDAGRRNEAGQALEHFEGCESKLLATMHIGLGEPDQPVEQDGAR